MKIWLLEPRNEKPWRLWYDKAFGFVIRAENEERARQIAHENGGDETSRDRKPWLDAKYSTCKELTSDGSEEMIIRDFASA